MAALANDVQVDHDSLFSPTSRCASSSNLDVKFEGWERLISRGRRWMEKSLSITWSGTRVKAMSNQQATRVWRREWKTSP